MKNKSQIKYIVSFAFIISLTLVHSQFNINGQLVQRGEYRHGYGIPILSVEDPAIFIGQRLRLNAEYKIDKVELYAAIQDIRIWGSSQQLKWSDNNFSLYEAYAKINFTPDISVKLGRQELNYDNFRFLGNVDWALQGRTHDIALFKFKKNKHILDLGLAYNQDAEVLSGNIYSDKGQYKIAQMLYYKNSFGKFNLATLFWNNGVQHVNKDNLGVIESKEIRYIQTIGISELKYDLGKTQLSAYYYHQLGKTIINKNVNAFNTSVFGTHTVYFKKQGDKSNELRLTLGAEIISGTNNNNTGNTSFTYIPMYSTGHIFNGYMDYFYVGGRNVANAGLIDGFLRTKYTFYNKSFLGFTGHYFQTYADVFDKSDIKLDNYLGTELDFVAGYVLSPSVSFQAGYSRMLGTSTLNFIQRSLDTGLSNVQDWTYLMVIIRPNSDKKFIGLNN